MKVSKNILILLVVSSISNLLHAVDTQKKGRQQTNRNNRTKATDAISRESLLSVIRDATRESVENSMYKDNDPLLKELVSRNYNVGSLCKIIENILRNAKNELKKGTYSVSGTSTPSEKNQLLKTMDSSPDEVATMLSNQIIWYYFDPEAPYHVDQDRRSLTDRKKNDVISCTKKAAHALKR